MFWFDNSRRNLVTYTQNLSVSERKAVELQFSEIVKNTLGLSAPILHFNRGDSSSINGYEVEFIKAIYRATSDKLHCIQSINRCMFLDGLVFNENDESIINQRGTCACIMLVETLDGPKIRKVPKETDPLARILREFQIMNSLNRIQEELNESYIIECEEDPRGGYIMEYATDSLYQYVLRIVGLPERDLAIKLTLRIIDCVNFLHINGVLHRDLHPGNWLFIMDKLKIADFGLACNITDDRSSKGYKPHYGVIDYTAKEQKESLENTSEQSDIYTVGRLINFVFTKSSQKNNHIFRNVTDRCTRSDPKQRYSSMAEVKAAVLRILSDMNLNVS